MLKRWRILPGFFRETKVQFLHTDDFVSLINLILNDDQIEGIFNVAPDTYSVVKRIVPDRIYIRVPVFLVTAIAYYFVDFQDTEF